MYRALISACADTQTPLESWLAREPGAEDAPASASEAAARWLARWDNLGKRIAEKGVDPRTTREILLADRR
jgi:hypothetical protein